MPYQHLTLEERSMIAPMRSSAGPSVTLRPNWVVPPVPSVANCAGTAMEPGLMPGYWAHRDAQRRRRAVRHSCLTSGVLATYVQEKLQCRWSPEQIAHRVRLDYPHASAMRISHQTIYMWLAEDHRTGGSWSRYLRHHRRRRKRYGSGPRAPRIRGRAVSGRPTGHRPPPRAYWRLGRGSGGRSRPERLRGHTCGPAQSLSPCGEGVAPDLPRRSRPSREKSCSRSRGRVRRTLTVDER